MEIVTEILAGGNSVFDTWETGIVGEEIFPEEWTLEEFEQAVDNAGEYNFYQMSRYTTWSPWPPFKGLEETLAANEIPQKLKTHIRKQRSGFFYYQLAILPPSSINH